MSTFARRMRVWVSICCTLVATSAAAAIYEHDTGFDDEEDLIDAAERGDISPETAETLVEAIREGVDLNTASRDDLYDLPGLTYTDVDAIIAFRVAKGRIDDASELVGAGAITPEQFIAIAPFIRIDAAGPKLPVSGKLRAAGQVTNADNVAPPAFLSAKLKGPYDLSAGVTLATTRRQMSTPYYEPLVDTLVYDGRPYMLNVPRVYARWKSGKRQLIAGTFGVGFGERATLDNTRRRTPHGFALTDGFRRARDLSRTCTVSSSNPLTGDCVQGENRYVTGDFNWLESFRGVAGSIEDLSLGGEQSLSLYGFASYQTRDVYQYHLYDKRVCLDPNDRTDPACKAPKVFLNEGVNTGQTRAIFSSLSYLYDEFTAGGHADFKPSFRYRLGVTGYGAVPFFRTAGPMELDFQRYAPHSGGGAYGAVGIDGEANFEQLSFHFEATRTFDNEVGGGGGFGVVQRTVFNRKRHDLQLSLRYYDDKYGNSNARPVSGPDQYDGLRARNEAGARLVYKATPNRDWEFQAVADFWVLPFSSARIGPAGMANLFVLGRVDFTGWNLFQPALILDVRNRNLASSEHGKCASGTVIFVEGEPFDCSGDLYRAALRLTSKPTRTVTISLQPKLTLKDDVRYKDRFMTNFDIWLEGRARLSEWFAVRMRTRYFDEDISDATYLETSWWTFVEAAWLPTKKTRVSLRYDLVFWLDQRPVTATRTPNPENRFFVDVRTAF